MASGAARWRGQDPKECGHPWHIVSRVPQQGGGVLAAGEEAAAIKGALPGVWGAGGWVFWSWGGQGSYLWSREALQARAAIHARHASISLRWEWGRTGCSPRLGSTGVLPTALHTQVLGQSHPNLSGLLPLVLASQAVQGCQPLPARKEVSEASLQAACRHPTWMEAGWKSSSPSSLAVPAHPASNKRTVNTG